MAEWAWENVRGAYNVFFIQATIFFVSVNFLNFTKATLAAYSNVRTNLSVDFVLLCVSNRAVVCLSLCAFKFDNICDISDSVSDEIIDWDW
ncbi:hypothetical protein D9M71_566520 [compost metagenome]